MLESSNEVNVVADLDKVSNFESGSLKTRVYGKVNLFLKVNFADKSGYHPLLSVFQPVDIFDDIVLKEVFYEHNKKHLVKYNGKISGENVFGDKDLCLRAINAFLNKLSAKNSNIVNKCFEIHVNKNIPVQGGMAGGSVDAAGVLCLLNEYFTFPFSVEELEKIAVNLGADVPFGIRNTLSIGDRYGDVIYPISLSQSQKDKVSQYFWVLVTNKRGLSTVEVFSKYDEYFLCNSVETGFSEYSVEGLCEKLLSSYENGENLASFISNDLQAVAVSLRPSLEQILSFGLEYGALQGFISGSGPTCVFLYDDENNALALKHAFEKHSELLKEIDEVLVLQSKF